jgi:hypothetical protein
VAAHGSASDWSTGAPSSGSESVATSTGVSPPPAASRRELCPKTGQKCTRTRRWRHETVARMPDGSRSRGKPDSPSTPRHTASSGRGNRVISPCPAGPTSHEAPHQQHRTVQCAVSVKGLRAVFGARRLETARRWPTSTDLTLVDPDGSDEAPRRPTGHRLGPAWVAGRVGQRADQTGRGEHRKDQTVAVQALADAAARLEQTGISQTRSARSRPVIAAAFPSARRRPVGVVRIVGVVAVVVSSSAPSHRKG